MTGPQFRLWVVPGDPLGKDRPRFDTVRRRTYTPDKTADAERLIAQAFRSQRGQGRWELDETNPFELDLVFYRANRRRRDIDNMTKLVMDALNGVAYKDDIQVTKLTVEVIYSDPDPRTEARLRTRKVPS